MKKKISPKIIRRSLFAALGPNIFKELPSTDRFMTGNFNENDF